MAASLEQLALAFNAEPAKRHGSGAACGQAANLTRW
jgi:hypothetical protein